MFSSFSRRSLSFTRQQTHAIRTWKGKSGREMLETYYSEMIHVQTLKYYDWNKRMLFHKHIISSLSGLFINFMNRKNIFRI